MIIKYIHIQNRTYVHVDVRMYVDNRILYRSRGWCGTLPHTVRWAVSFPSFNGGGWQLPPYSGGGVITTPNIASVGGVASISVEWQLRTPCKVSVE